MLRKSSAPKSAMDKIREHFNQTSGSDNRWLSIPEPQRGEKETKTVIRVCGPWNKTTAEGFFYFTAALHYGFSIGGRNRAIVCNESIGKGDCPVCKFIGKLKNSGDENLEKLAERLRFNRRYWVNCIDRGDEEAGIKIYGGNKKFIEAILDASDEAGDITDKKTGRDITIVRTGKGFATRYRYSVKMKSSVADYKTSDLHQLDKDVVEPMTYSQIVQVMQENFSDELEEVGMVFKSSKKKSKKKPKLSLVKKRKVEVEEDEEDFEDVDIDFDDDEEEED